MFEVSIYMTCYVVTYDLKKPGQNYEPLYTAIKSYGTWAHINESTWAVVTEQKAPEIRDFLKKFIDANDSLFVLRSGVEAAWMNPLCKNEWLKDNL